jgi:hypothetical protein
MKLTSEQIKNYLENGGNKCPYCGSENISGGHFETDSNEAWQPVSCDDCGREWSDLYRLVGIYEESED